MSDYVGLLGLHSLFELLLATSFDLPWAFPTLGEDGPDVEGHKDADPEHPRAMRLSCVGGPLDGERLTINGGSRGITVTLPQRDTLMIGVTAKMFALRPSADDAPKTGRYELGRLTVPDQWPPITETALRWTGEC